MSNILSTVRPDVVLPRFPQFQFHVVEINGRVVPTESLSLRSFDRYLNFHPLPSFTVFRFWSITSTSPITSTFTRKPRPLRPREYLYSLFRVGRGFTRTPEGRGVDGFLKWGVSTPSTLSLLSLLIFFLHHSSLFTPPVTPFITLLFPFTSTLSSPRPLPPSYDRRPVRMEPAVQYALRLKFHDVLREVPHHPDDEPPGFHEDVPCPVPTFLPNPTEGPQVVEGPQKDEEKDVGELHSLPEEVAVMFGSPVLP